MKTAGLRQISERYVTALWSVASDVQAIGAVEKDLIVLAAAVKDSEEFAAFVANPLLDRNAQAQIVEAMLANIGAHELTRKFAALLARNKRLGALTMVAEIFAKKAAMARGELGAELISASELKSAEVATVADKLGKIFGKKVAVKARVNPELLGGVVIKIGSQQLDGSVSGKLARLRNMLKVA